MGDFKNKIARFMQGRYGADQLYIATIAGYFLLMIINLFFSSVVVTRIITGLMSVLLIWGIYRVFSRNIYKRYNENQKFLKLLSPLKLLLRRIKGLRTHRYRRCPNCKTVLRLPFKRGKHTTKCPRCKNKCNVRILV